MFRGLILALPLTTMACGLGAGTQPGFSFLDPGVRSGQEQACAGAVAQRQGVPVESVTVNRTSADAHNKAIVAFAVGGLSGYCRVSAGFRVLAIS